MSMSSPDSTSIRIDRATLNRLNERKGDGESHDDLVNRMLDEYGAE